MSPRNIEVTTFPQQQSKQPEFPLQQLVEFIEKNNTIQLTSFGPTGLVIIHTLSKYGLLSRLPVVFIDTLYHFPETYQLIEEVKSAYPEMNLVIYKPKGCETKEDFEKKFGTELWERQPSKFAYYSKVEPRDRAMKELKAVAYINGRRKSQGVLRAELEFSDVDEEMDIIRVQPLYQWNFEQVWSYIRSHNLAYNKLHDKGYKSVGDYMTTSPVGAEEDERSGRWKGKSQSECGLHVSPKLLELIEEEESKKSASVEAF